ncbi:hypothetical protein CDQ84_17800 [Clostridium thermosuccinogenes]|uniref:beta-fructofuranosidase n=1 Tax=Clostridium thermosuccinogenes TaxID=84032 RepID=A0A2K2F737_9CLOT|nr:InlB B-repeat-containing protein [Pseudoclostridium thermosuccinogenes]AUS97278.1 hypothetical protein CDO33_13035 [Pseudoclostridium thermosuccinogenes]PNT94592.1 hypothetical protein CDQ85_17715 [Pseudoclostridium thermosuccinogenes]PNT95046.1 hypothetical protein CDQ84_17800 [Pseudoclostridium thermosuccinogenes]
MRNKDVVLWIALCLIVSVLLCSCRQSGAPVTVHFNGNYYGCGEIGSQTVHMGSKLEELDAPTRDGYVFLGWFKDKGLIEKWDFEKDKVYSELTLYAGWDRDSGDEIKYPDTDKDFTNLRTPGSQEMAYDYRLFFLPEKDGVNQPYVGDPMPYYEDGVYYIYYLKDGGDSYNHSIYLVTTKDFLNYKEYDEPVLEASRSGGQDGWIGTGSVVKVGEKYYFFYTGHASSDHYEYKEKIMIAEGRSPTEFKKIVGWEITPPAELGQKNDFRDPQAYYDAENNVITLTVTASQNNVARILKYTISADLMNVQYDGIIFTDPTGDFWNLECSDTFKLGNKWYITYSAQNDTLWYAFADNQFGPYSEPKRLEGKLFYAAKHVSDGEYTYMVGWARRSESPSSTQEVSGWGGNLVVQKLVQKEDRSLILSPLDKFYDAFAVRRALILDGTGALLESGALYSYKEVFTAFERFMLTGEFCFTGNGSFGLAFDYDGQADNYKLISIDPANNKLQLYFNGGKTLISETDAVLEAGRDYSFTYIQEGSVGIFYIDGLAALTVRLYGVNGKAIRLFAENNSVVFSSLREYTM